MNAAAVARERLAAHHAAFGHVYAVLPPGPHAPGPRAPGDLAVDGAQARDLAHLVPSQVAAGPLAGVPFAVKDLFDLEGRVTRSGALLTAGDAPAERSAAVVRMLEAAGAVAVATTAMDEFAHGFTTRNDHFGDCLNPRDPSRIAGGSSGGSAAAVALGDVAIALGSDTNGSGRVPASLCGVYGLKPGFGLVPTDGLQPLAPSLDHVSWFATTADLCEQVLDAVTAVPRETDAPAADAGSAQVGRLADALPAPRIAFADVTGLAGTEALAAVCLVAEALGAHHGSAVVDLPSLERTLDASLLITAAEGAAVHARRLRESRDGFGRSARIGLTAGAFLPVAAVDTARRYREWLEGEYRRLFGEVDVLVLPTTPVAAPGLDETSIRLGDGRVVGREPWLGIFTAPFSLLGLPALSVPVQTDSLPIGVQLVGARRSERTLLALAREIERGTGVFTPLTAPPVPEAVVAGAAA